MSNSIPDTARYDLQLGTSVNSAMSALAIYEFIITIDQEFSAVWRREKSIATLLLLATRWSMLLQAILDIFNPESSAGCKAISISSAALLVFTGLVGAAFSGVRVYALWNRNFKLSIVVFLLLLPPVVVNTYGYINATNQVLPFFGCVRVYELDDRTLAILIRVARIPVIVGDASVVVLTWIQSARHILEGRRLKAPLPLTTILFRDGTVYFLVLFVMSVLELCPNLPQSGILFSYINGGLPQILIHRFMLNLRQLKPSGLPASSHARTISMPMFNLNLSVDMVGNMGEPLEHGPVDEDYGDEAPARESEAEAEAGPSTLTLS